MRSPEQNAPRFAAGAQGKAESLLGDFSALLQQVGVRGVLPVCNAPAADATAHINDPAALQIFLDGYFGQLLQPVELPAIARACAHGRTGELRELLELDRQLGSDARLEPLAGASRKIGALQLQRMKPLRDERLVQRYLRAVEAGEAGGWHTLVYGLTLAVYSIPLRQGLLHYGRETMAALARAAAGSKRFFNSDCQNILGSILDRLPQAVDQIVPASEVVTVPPRRYSQKSLP